MPPIASRISACTALTALRTPLPPYRLLSPSRSSTASWAPVEAPEGTAARPKEPSSRSTSTSIVGLPRLSRISRAAMLVIAVMQEPSGRYGVSKPPLGEARSIPQCARHGLIRDWTIPSRLIRQPLASGKRPCGRPRRQTRNSALDRIVRGNASPRNQSVSAVASAREQQLDLGEPILACLGLG